MSEPKRKIVPQEIPLGPRTERATQEAMDLEENMARSKGDVTRTDWFMIVAYFIAAVVVIGGAVLAWRGGFR